MKLIANETEYARLCLEQGYIDKKQPYKSIRTVVRYLNQKCGIENVDDLYDMIENYIESTGKVVNIDKGTIIQMRNEENSYNELESISLTSRELYTIMNNGYPHSWRKVLFVMLVHYKVKKAIYTDVDNRRIDADLSIIMNDAHTTLSVEKRIQMLAQFEADGYIEIPNGGKQAKYIFLNYIDDELDDELVVIDNFFDFYLFFEQYVKGGKLIYCQECGRLVLTKGNNTKYCKNCSHNPHTKKVHCEHCGEIFKPKSNSQKYCDRCSKLMSKKKGAERVSEHRKRKQTSDY